MTTQRAISIVTEIIRENRENGELEGVLITPGKYIQPKIRQQLQVLRDTGVVKFLGPGSYRLR
jgi:hypothetical protein